MTKVLDRETARTIFEKMALIRAGEDRIMRGLGSGEFAFSFYPVRGQEAIAATAGTVLREDDQITTTHRCFHDVIAKGVPMPQVLAEMMGKATGTSKGKGGPMHLADPRHGLMLTTGIVGGGVPIAVGLALASALEGSGRVVVANLGDGSTSIGATHEAMNLAALWDLPLIFLCQNNGFSEHTPFRAHTRTEELSRRATGYGMPGLTVDGGVVPELHTALTDALQRARNGLGPTFIEARTRRVYGHAFGADQPYRVKEELEQAQAAEPVGPYRQWLIDEQFANETWVTEIEARAAQAADEAVAFAKNSPSIASSERLTDVFAMSQEA